MCNGYMQSCLPLRLPLHLLSRPLESLPVSCTGLYPTSLSAEEKVPAKHECWSWWVKRYAVAQVISISDPNERDVCHTLELRIHECVLGVFHSASRCLLPAVVTDGHGARGARDPFCAEDRRAHFQWFSYRHGPILLPFCPLQCHEHCWLLHHLMPSTTLLDAQGFSCMQPGSSGWLSHASRTDAGSAMRGRRSSS